MALNSIGMKFHLKHSENFLIQFKTIMLKDYIWKGINVNIEFCTILLLIHIFKKCRIIISTPKKMFFLITFFGEKLLLNRICIQISIGSKHHTQIFRGICAVIRKLWTISWGVLYLFPPLIYIYIKSSTDISVSFYQNSSVWLDMLAFRSWDRNPVDSKANPRLYPSATSNQQQRITITIVYIHPLNGYKELNSYMKNLAQTLMATRLLHSL